MSAPLPAGPARAVNLPAAGGALLYGAACILWGVSWAAPNTGGGDPLVVLYDGVDDRGQQVWVDSGAYSAGNGYSTCAVGILCSNGLYAAIRPAAIVQGVAWITT